jgi:hypothetical protein
MIRQSTGHRSVLLLEETGLLEENHWSYIRYVLNTNVHEFILIIFLLFVHIIRLFYRQVCFISKGLGRPFDNN